MKAVSNKGGRKIQRGSEKEIKVYAIPEAGQRTYIQTSFRLRERLTPAPVYLGG